MNNNGMEYSLLLRGSNGQLEGKQVPTALFLVTSLDTSPQVQQLLLLSSRSHIHLPTWLLHLDIQKPCPKLSSWPSQPCLPRAPACSLPYMTQSTLVVLRPKPSKPSLTLFLLPHIQSITINQSHWLDLKIHRGRNHFWSTGTTTFQLDHSYGL